WSAFFEMRDRVGNVAPSLLGRWGIVAKWQALSAVALVGICFLVAVVPAILIVGLMRLAFGRETLRKPRQIRNPLILAIAMLLWQALSPYLGMPNQVRSVTLPLEGVVMTLSLLLLAWRLIDLLSSNYDHTVDAVGLDRIAFSLAMVILRAVLAGMAAINIADQLSLPFSGFAAGLGIGGL